MNRRCILTKEFLMEQYINQKKSSNQIGFEIMNMSLIDFVSELSNLKNVKIILEECYD